MTAKFVIIYAGREGSSALVEALGTRANIRVPLFENLDRHWVQRYYPEIDVADEIDTVLKTGQFTLGPEWSRRPRGPQGQNAGQPEAIGFKWRPHQSWRKAIGVLHSHDAAVIMMTRSFPDIVASRYFSHVKRQTEGPDAVGAGHYQFRFSSLSEEDKRVARDELAKARVPFSFVGLHVMMLRCAGNTFRKVLFLLRARIAGCKTGTVSYETLLASPQAAASEVAEYLSIRDLPGGEDLKFEKPTQTPAPERVVGFNRLRWSPIFWLVWALDSASIRAVRKLDRPPSADVFGGTEPERRRTAAD